MPAIDNGRPVDFTSSNNVASGRRFGKSGNILTQYSSMDPLGTFYSKRLNGTCRNWRWSTATKAPIGKIHSLLPMFA